MKWNGRHIPKSPFRVEVGQDLDASQAYASGPGLQPTGVQAGKYTDFTVYTKGAGEGQVSVKVIDPRGGEDVDIIIEPQEDGQYFVEYQPVNAGKHTIKVMFGGQPISRSPFHVTVSPPRIEPIPSKVRVFGTGKSVVKVCNVITDYELAVDYLKMPVMMLIGKIMQLMIMVVVIMIMMMRMMMMMMTNNNNI